MNANAQNLTGGFPIAREILGDMRDSYGDLRNLQIDFAHTGGNGAVEA